MPELHVLRVFVNEDGEWGNPLGVFLDGGAVPEEERQEVAAELGFSETVFVDDRETRPDPDLHPRSRAALRRPPDRRHRLAARRDRHAGRAPCRPRPARSASAPRAPTVYVAGRAEWVSELEYLVELGSPAEVRALAGPPGGSEAAYVWAWIDEDAGTIRARCFIEEAGIAEDEATGAAAIVLCDAARQAGDDPPGQGLGARRARRSATAGSRSAAASASTRCAIIPSEQPAARRRAAWRGSRPGSAAPRC